VTVGGAVMLAARGRNPRGTARAGWGATGGSKPEGIFNATRRGAGVEVPIVVRWGPNYGNYGARLTKKIEVS
jgi:hypothetical protein